MFQLTVAGAGPGAGNGGVRKERTAGFCLLPLRHPKGAVPALIAGLRLSKVFRGFQNTLCCWGFPTISKMHFGVDIVLPHGEGALPGFSACWRGKALTQSS